MKIIKVILCCLILSTTALLIGCTQKPPDRIESICSIFKQYPEWYWDAQYTRKKWGVPISVLMAIIYQESHFRATAKPPRTKLLWVIPWKRPTSAYGYSQAITNTWKRYKKDTNRSFASRDAFGDAADFIGWYVNYIHHKLDISPKNAEQIYLAYHEGTGNYRRGTHHKKAWLLNVAKKVQSRAWTYNWQLSRCEKDLPKKPWWKKIF